MKKAQSSEFVKNNWKIVAKHPKSQKSTTTDYLQRAKDPKTCQKSVGLGKPKKDSNS